MIPRPLRSTLFPYHDALPIFDEKPRFPILDYFGDSRGRRRQDRDLAGLGLQDGERQPLLRRGQKRSEEHTSELQSRENLVCRLLLEKKKQPTSQPLDLL